mgnify:FL=1
MENENSQNEYEIKKEAKEQEFRKAGMNRKLKKVFRTCLMLLVPVLAVSGFVWYLVKNIPANPDQGGELNACVQHGGIGMHIHPRVSITVDGQPQKLPSNIGITSLCMRPIHTHDDSGTLHLEFRKPRAVKLGEFFQVWEKAFSEKCIFDHCNGAGKNVKLFVNGKENLEFGEYIMKDKDNIEIKYE